MKINCSYTDMVDIDLLVPNPKNPNKHPDEQIKYLAKIMNHQGWRHPIIVSNLSGFVVSGHGRLMAARKNGWTKAPVDKQDFANEADEYAHLIADNKIAELAEHDDQMMIEDLKLFPDLDLELLGIPDFEMPVLLEPGCDEDDVPEFEKNGWVKRGDLFQLGEHRLLCGDSTSITDVERLMNGEKADMVFTDPPYGMALKTDYRNSWGEQSDSSGSIGFRNGKNHRRVLGDEKEFDFLTAYSTFESCKEQFWWGADYYCQQLPKNCGWLVWDKTGGNELLMNAGFNANFELCWSKQKHKRDLIRYTYKGVAGMKKEDGLRVHPTQKPIGLAEHFIKKWAEAGAAIVDLYGGSGSTLIACEKTNRKCFMMELDEHYCSVIIERWEKFSNKKAFIIKEDGSKISWDEVKNDSKNN